MELTQRYQNMNILSDWLISIKFELLEKKMLLKNEDDRTCLYIHLKLYKGHNFCYNISILVGFYNIVISGLFHSTSSRYENVTSFFGPI